MKIITTKTHHLAVVFSVIFAFGYGNAQNCPGFQPGNPANNLYAVGFFDIADLQIANCNCQYDGNGFKCGNCKPVLFTTYRYVSSGVPIVCFQMALPVELRSFYATAQNGDVKLNWITESEKNNAGFIIERSSDAVDYTLFSEKKGSVNNTVATDYEMADTDPLKGVSYYRLSQRDLDGKVTQLAVVSVEMSSALSGTVIAPNPSPGETKLLLPWHSDGQMFDVTICNNIGVVVNTFQASEDTELELNPGVYSIVVRNGSQTWSEKLVMLD